MDSNSWIKFLRKYGPIPRNDNMYDETIQRISRKCGIDPIKFDHPFHYNVVSCFNKKAVDPQSVILTGTAGDGKTHLCRQVWKMLNGKDEKWASDNPYLSLNYRFPKDRKSWPDSSASELFRKVTVHFIRDLSSWAPQQGHEWGSDKENLLHRFCQSLFDSECDDVFLIAGNDGQLIESFRRLKDTEYVKKTRNVLEELLVEDRQNLEGIRLQFFNLSRGSSSELFNRAVKSFLDHSAWQTCMSDVSGENEAFGPKCPIRKNYELLKTPLVRHRLSLLFELCDYNNMHLPIRQILLLLTNAVLGHEDVKDRLMLTTDIPNIIAKETVSKASIYNNIFGGNLSKRRRDSITIFDYFDRFQIGYETSNRIDNILIFGEGDENLGDYFDQFIGQDNFYGADSNYYAAKREYIEAADDGSDKTDKFLKCLINQRRGLFFKIPKDAENEIDPWSLTVFRFAGEYLNSVAEVLKKGEVVKRPILSQLIKGLNRIFTGMLMSSERELFLATSGSYSQSKISRVLIDRISVPPNKGEKVTLDYDKETKRIFLSVYFSNNSKESLKLNLVRYEFISRIANEGALPASFSKECYEDILAFKSRLITAYTKRQEFDGSASGDLSELKLLSLSDKGVPEEKVVEVIL